MLDPEVAIDRINGAYGRHARSRALHAKGRFYEGTFTASAEAGRPLPCGRTCRATRSR